MTVAEFKICLDNTPATEEQLELFSEIRIDQAIGMATEAELTINIGLDDSGCWTEIEESYVQPSARIRVEVKIREGDFVPLIDGPVIGQRFELSGSPNDSKLTLVVQDDSVLMNQDEAVELYEDQSADEVAQQLFQAAGLTSETDSVATPAADLTRFLVRRGTAMQFLKELARRHSMFVYVEPGSSPGTSIGYFKRPELSSSDYPELLLVGAGRNINKFSGQFDGLRPLKARADSINITDQEIVSSETEASDIDAQGDEAVHDFTEAGQILLARTRELSDDLESSTVAAVNHSSWAYSANAEVIADSYEAVLLPHRVVSVAGAGGHLSGNWLVSQVTHTISDASYKQAFSLRRNARSSGNSGGGLLGGVF
jgi:phage protein D